MNISFPCPHCAQPVTINPAEFLGQAGGQATSDRKANAARRNAKLGGWPKGRKRGPKIQILQPATSNPKLPDPDEGEGDSFVHDDLE